MIPNWLGAKSAKVLLHESIRVVDIGAKAQLHAWIDEFARPEVYEQSREEAT